MIDVFLIQKLRSLNCVHAGNEILLKWPLIERSFGHNLPPQNGVLLKCLFAVEAVMWLLYLNDFAATHHCNAKGTLS